MEEHLPPHAEQYVPNGDILGYPPMESRRKITFDRGISHCEKSNNETVESQYRSEMDKVQRRREIAGGHERRLSDMGRKNDDRAARPGRRQVALSRAQTSAINPITMEALPLRSASEGRS